MESKVHVASVSICFADSLQAKPLSRLRRTANEVLRVETVHSLSGDQGPIDGKGLCVGSASQMQVQILRGILNAV